MPTYTRPFATAGAPTMPSPASEMPPAFASGCFQTVWPVSALTATTVPRLVAVKTQPSATTGVDWIVPPSGIGVFHPSASLPTLSLVIVVSAV